MPTEGIKAIDHNMKLPDLEKFHLKNLNELRLEIKQLNLDIPIDDDLSPLREQLKIGGKIMPNRFCVQPMEGCDAQPDGSPGSLTFRRYTRYAQGGFGLIWLEATAVAPEARSSPAQLFLHEHNVKIFTKMVETIRDTAQKSSGKKVIVILQLAHSGRYSRPQGVLKPVIIHHNSPLDSSHGIPKNYPLAPDDYLDGLQDAYVKTARLAAEAGFDGVDVKSCHKDLIAELHASFTRPGKYGGTFENRTRFIRETMAKIKKNLPGLLITTRMSAYDAISYPYGFGVNKEDYQTPDLDEPVKLVKSLQEIGIHLLNVSIGNPRLTGQTGRTDEIMEHPLKTLERSVSITRKIQKAFPDLPVAGGDYSWLREFMPYVAAGVIKTGGAAIAGVGRGALAYPDAVKDILGKGRPACIPTSLESESIAGRMDSAKCCITCSACSRLIEDGGTAGCVIRDSEIYGPEYRRRRHFALENLIEEARRCHYCEAAPCAAACPTRIDVPSFIKAFADNDIKKAYEIIRRSNVLPEMCSHLCPTSVMCEGACIETVLSERPIPILDIQYTVCWLAREQGLTGVHIPKNRSGNKIAVIGSGPAGLACAIKLLEYGHDVTIFEKDNQLGGTPNSVIPERRFMDPQPEINAILEPALKAGRLKVRFGEELGKNLDLKSLREQNDAVLLAAGLWRELTPYPQCIPTLKRSGSRRVGKVHGVIDSLTFLRKTKNGEIKSVPEKVAVLTGGDSAMDSALTARELGAVELYIVYGGSFSEMHWHMADDLLKTKGVHCLFFTQPMGYKTGKTSGGRRITGLKICKTELGPPDASGNKLPVLVPKCKSVLKVDMVIEAMGLGISSGIKKELKGVSFTKYGLVETAEDSYSTEMKKVFVAGALINGGASVVQCIAEGMKAAEEIDKNL